ncbi:hypothetical protein RI129_003140 [Pyrocoelia pectoralis]|uniref:Dynein attachment factor N-terminal domain-containing protein n=1 Tax=Pyrocoelia pectoralis TaxID=417401 RepID=A0AAN7ZUM5_9COLE
MSRLTSKVDNKQLMEELQSAIDYDKLYWIRNDAKIKAIATAKSYDDFRESVSAAHLNPVYKNDWKKKINTWNTFAKPKSQE